MTDAPNDGEEPTLVLKDENDEYYLIPMKHLPSDKVAVDQVKALEAQLRRRRGAAPGLAQPKRGEDISAAPAPLAIQAVGVVDLTRDIRRRFVGVSVRDIPGLVSPPS